MVKYIAFRKTQKEQQNINGIHAGDASISKTGMLYSNSNSVECNC
ncbi:MAG: hypothetical protein R2829_10035 [Bacteroidia bacterium]